MQPSTESVIAPTKPPATALLPLFAATLFFASLLMFAIEPIVAKTVLPILGGTPMVWNTCVLFFQIVLLAGYACAHGLATRVAPRVAAAAYAAILVAPLLTLPFALDAGARPPAGAMPAGWLLIVLMKSIGVPFFALAATAPLLQRSFATTDHRSARDPYFLYAASNAGSLLALVAYPTVVEPALRLRTQNVVWTAAYCAFAACALASLAAASRRRRLPAAFAEIGECSENTATPDSAPATLVDWQRRLSWTALAFVPSSLMLAVTTYFSTDIAPVPLFWVAPLALYLLTFVAAFSARTTALQNAADRWLPLAALPLLLLIIAGAGISLWVAIPLHLGAFTLAAFVCHGRLSADRPAASRLTEFYFWIAFGGMLGGLFNTLAAPLLFTRVVEYPLVLVVALAARRGGTRVDRSSASTLRSAWTWSASDVAIPAAVGVVSALLLAWLRPGPGAAQMFVGALGLPAFVSFTQSRQPRRFAACAAAMIVAGSLAVHAHADAYASRTFFGVYRVTAYPPGYRSLYHGTTVHGMQSTDPARAGEPLTYYHRGGPIGQLFAGLPDAATRRHVAVVGLGVGTLATYRSPGQQWTFYEIDPEVERIARSERSFTYLRDCGAQCRVALGDARLSMAAASDDYGLIVLDAFSSDAIPVHLMTDEAMTLYLERLAPDGVLVFHITNRHLMLAPVLARLARNHDLVARWQQHRATDTEKTGQFSSDWLVMARRAADLGTIATDQRWTTPAVGPRTPLWTDDFSNIVSVLSLTPH